MPNDQAIKSRVLRKPLPTVDYLRECFMYDPETGVLVWKERPREHFETTSRWLTFNGKRVGTTAGWVGGDKGYCHVCINGHDHKAARVIWKLMTGEDPPHEIDHKDRNRANNRWSNLRTATSYEQSYNRVRTDNHTGYRGVAVHGRKWRATIMLEGVSWSSSYVDTPEEASAIYEVMAERLHGKFYHNSSKGE